MDICSAEPAAVALKSLILDKNDETEESMFYRRDRQKYRCGRQYFNNKVRKEVVINASARRDFPLVRAESPADRQQPL